MSWSPAGRSTARASTSPTSASSSRPAKGVFTRAESLEGGEQVARGARLGTVRTNREEHVVTAPEAGVLAEWLREDGDIVPAGLPVARLADGSEF